ncbi:MAG: hypothetical protein ACM3PS_06595 [Syntrophothermus sp.]
MYALLLGLPGVLIAGTISVFLFAGVTGLLWLYVFGDNPWPAYVEPILSGLFVLTTLTLWILSIVVGYLIGKRLEKDPAMNRAHILISAGVTLFFILLIVFQQWSAGNLGPRSASTQCSDFCTLHGYAGSGMPPEISGDRTCSCYDSSGNEVLRIPLDHLSPVDQK